MLSVKICTGNELLQHIELNTLRYAQRQQEDSFDGASDPSNVHVSASCSSRRATSILHANRQTDKCTC